MSLYTRLCEVHQRFSEDRRGTTAVIFALTLVAVMMGVGAAVDYSRAAKARAHLQALVDAAALAGARLANATESQRQVAAMAYFGSANSGDPTASVAVANGTVTVNAQSALAASLLGVVGIDQIPIAAQATAAMQATTAGGGGLPVCVSRCRRNGPGSFRAICRCPLNGQMSSRTRKYVTIVK